MKDRRLFKRYLISYLLVLCIPLILLGVVVQRYFLQSYGQSLLREKTLQLTQVQTALEAQLKPLQNFAAMISLDNRFTLYAIENKPTAYIEILQELRYLMHINSSLHEVLFHPLGSDQYYQSMGTTTGRFLFSSIMRYEELDSDTCEAFFAQLRTPGWLKTQVAYGGELVYTYLHPLPMNKSVVLFQIQAKALDALFPDEQTSYLLTDALGRLFHVPNGRTAAFADFPLPEAGAMTPLTWAGVPYYAYRTPVGEGYFSITALIPRAQITRATQEFARAYYVVLTAVVLLGAAVVWGMLRLNYRPIQRLGTAARALDRSVPEHLDSLESAYHALHSLASHPPLRDADLQAMRQARLFRLLRGQYESIEAFNADCERLDLYLSGSRFRVIILSGAYESEGAMPGPGLFEQLHRLLAVEFEAFLLEYVEQFSYILILSEEPGQEAALPQRLEMLQAHYRETARRELLVGIGEPYASPADILRSYGEAKAALQCGLTRAANPLYWYRDLEQAHPPASYPNEELAALHAALVNGQPAKVEFIVQLLIDMIRNQFKSLFLSVCLCYDIVNVILRALQEIHCTSAALDAYAALRERRALGSVEELTETVGRLCRDAVSLLEAEQAREASLDMRAVLEYIDRHKADPDFCVGSLADRFDLSISNFSHQFKSQLGVNVSTYINDLRLREAQLLLRSTDLSVGEIALRIGYLQPSSFIRKFKQTLGQTPGEYRQQNGRSDP